MIQLNQYLERKVVPNHRVGYVVWHCDVRIPRNVEVCHKTERLRAVAGDFFTNHLLHLWCF